MVLVKEVEEPLILSYLLLFELFLSLDNGADDNCDDDNKNNKNDIFLTFIWCLL